MNLFFPKVGQATTLWGILRRRTLLLPFSPSVRFCQVMYIVVVDVVVGGCMCGRKLALENFVAVATGWGGCDESGDENVSFKSEKERNQ